MVDAITARMITGRQLPAVVRNGQAKQAGLPDG